MAGCIPIGYAYPTVSYVPALAVAAPPDEVYAFRVDVADDDNSIEFPEADEYVLTGLPLDRDGRFDPQVKVSMDYGWFWNWIAAIYNEHTHHTVMVRLYRPGYHTVEIASWDKPGSVKWEAAGSLADQEQAVDELVSTWDTSSMAMQHVYTRTEPPRDPSVFKWLAPGSTADEHQRALQFAASEYERLQRTTTDREIRVRLDGKARDLRILAAR
jgi:hypothetical protein